MADIGRKTKHVEARWTDVILVCRKCSKKLPGGFGPGGDQSFGKAMRNTIAGASNSLGGGKGKRRRETVAVVEVGCLDICPKRAVVVLRAAAPHRWLVVPQGTDLGEVATDLGLDPIDGAKACG